MHRAPTAHGSGSRPARRPRDLQAKASDSAECVTCVFLPRSACLEPCRHSVLRDPISFLQTRVFTLLDVKIEVR